MKYEGIKKRTNKLNEYKTDKLKTNIGSQVYRLYKRYKQWSNDLYNDGYSIMIYNLITMIVFALIVFFLN